MDISIRKIKDLKKESLFGLKINGKVIFGKFGNIEK